MAMSDEDLAKAIENCDRAPIHVPGSVQGFGCLFATDAGFERFEFVSPNAAAISGEDATRLLGAEASRVFSAEEAHAIRNALGHDSIERQREFVGTKTIAETDHQITAHRRGGRAIVELIPERRPATERLLAVEQARGFLAHRIGLEDVLAHAVERLRFMTGYDRVKAYHFLPDGSGEVVAESRSPEVPSFLGLRFPASDIPPRARTLYASTPIRVIHDTLAEDAPLLALDPAAEPLDQSLAVLRGCAAVHIQYLRNMSVRSTMTLPIVVDGALWGLFAAHHRQPLRPDPSVLLAAELSGKLVSLRVQHALEMRRQEQLRACSSVASSLVVVDDSELAASQYWTRAQDEIAAMIPSDGFVFAIDGELEAFGRRPPLDACRALLALADPREPGFVAIDDLQARLPGAEWGETGGALILSICDRPKARLAFLRDLAETSIAWAGAPSKDVVQSAEGPQLNPRHSFETYRQTVRGRSLEWTSEDREIAAALRSALAQAFDAQSRLKDHRHRLGLLVRELNHRVRNILSLVQSLSVQSRDAAASVEAYATALEQRIVALAGAHNLLTRSEMQGARLRDLLELELRPFNGGAARIGLDGPDVSLRPDAAPVAALVIHELTSNAAKYGALSTEGGRVEAGWRFEEEGLALSWRERGGPPVAGPSREGFGRSIIERAIPYEFGGRAQLRFEPGGVVANFWLPGDLIAEGRAGGAPLEEERSASPSEALSPSPDAPLAGGRRALVVEDNFVIAMQMKRLLAEAGFAEIDAAATAPEALSHLARRDYDFCLLDVSLRGEFSVDVARELERRKVTFFFATGYGSEGGRIVAAFGAPVISKPIDPGALKAALLDLFNGGQTP